VQASFGLEEPTSRPILPNIIAFALGYREDTFRDLLRRVVDLLATAGGGDTEPPSAPPRFWYHIDIGRELVTFRWTEARDNVDVKGYNLYRDGLLRAELGSSQRRFLDRLEAPDSRYLLTAIDAARNESDPVAPARVEDPATLDDIDKPERQKGEAQ
jgi:hypothetical protein